MKINPRALFSTSGISCVKLSLDAATDDLSIAPAHAVFITQESVAAARAKGIAAEPNTPDVSYGDVLVLTRFADGRSLGEHVPAGRDAGVALRILTEEDGEYLLPFTGKNMLLAREKLFSLSDRGVPLQPEQRKTISGIQGLFEVIMAHPDPDRFGPVLIGQAFQSSMIDSLGDVSMPVSDEEFGRKARADLLRAKIARIDPEHPDALGSARALLQILSNTGINPEAASYGAAATGLGGARITEDGLRRMVAANDRLSREVFGAMTRTSIENLSAAAISFRDFERIRGGALGPLLSGPWIEAVGDRLEAIFGDRISGYHCDMIIVSRDGQDILTLSDPVSAQNGLAFIYAWPTAHRLVDAEIGKGHVVNISPEEVPSEGEIRRLATVLDHIETRAAYEDDPTISDLLPQRLVRTS